MDTITTPSPLVGTPPPDRDVQLRERIMEYVLRDTDPGRQGSIKRLYTSWRDWNKDHFEQLMVVPLIFLNEPSNPRRLGDCGPVSGFGCSSQIRIRPSLLTGTHPRMRAGAAYAEGRFTFVADVLLHEMIHQWQQEVSGQRDEGYHGHGPAFRGKANEIGARLGLPPVRTSKGRGKDAGLPSCSYWPHIVRGEGFYHGAYVPTSRDAKKPGIIVPADLDGACSVLREHFDIDALCKRLQA